MTYDNEQMTAAGERETAAVGRSAASAEVWWSSEQNPRSRDWFSRPEDVRYTLSRRPDLVFVPPGAGIEVETVIAVDPGFEGQEMLGIGISLEETTVHNMRRMSAEAREALLKRLVDAESGAGFSLIRIALGTSDFTGQPFYSYDDLADGEEDFEMARFSIRRDIELGIVGTLQRIRELAPDAKFFASSWSPPAWMKTSGSLMRGRLKEGAAYTKALAVYFRKAIEAYAEAGIPIHAITLQNEPLFEIDYPSCHMPPERQRELAVAVRKELDAHALNTEIWIFDHNFDDAWDYVPPILNDADGAAAASGIALHDYGGEPEVMGELRSAYPGHPIYLTERSLWGVEAADRFIRYFRSGASSYNAWVTMLDSDIRPHQWTGTPDPTLLVQDAADYDRVWATPEFYLTAQFSRFVRPGARLLGTPYGSPERVTNAAFRNADGSIVVVVANQTAQPQPIRIVAEGKQLAASVPAHAVATYRWEGAAG